MQDAALMRVMDPAADLHEEQDDLSEWMLAFQPRRKVAAFDEPHREVMRAVLLAAFVERDDVRVMELRDGFNLDAEAQARFIGKQVMRLHHLQRDEAVQPELACAIDHSHAAARDFVNDLVIRKKAGFQSRR